MLEKINNIIKSIDSIIHEIVEKDDELEGWTRYNQFKKESDTFDIKKFNYRCK